MVGENEQISAVVGEDKQTSNMVGEDEQTSDEAGEDDQMVPEAPPCSEEEEEMEEEKIEDNVDGWMADWVVDSIKSAVYHLLDLTIRMYCVDRCYGCKINHPSQRQHECLEVLEDDFRITTTI